jgi:hypothetical protein
MYDLRDVNPALFVQETLGRAAVGDFDMGTRGLRLDLHTRKQRRTFK